VKRRTIWVLISGLLVAMLLLASCAPAAPAPKPAPTPAPTPTPAPKPAPTPVAPAKEMVRDSMGRMVEKPKYGGLLTVAHSTDVLGFDEAYAIPYNRLFLDLTHEELLMGDWLKGPAGTGEWPFSNQAFLPKFEAACLAESYEILDPKTLVFHIRKGVHFALEPASEASRLVGGREMTADDVVASLKRLFEIPGTYHLSVAKGSFELESMTAPDKYKVIVKVARDAGMALPYLADMAHIFPREVLEKYKNVRDWRTTVGTGTGPFVLTDYVPGSAATFRRNQSYWGKDPLHPENSLPYIDGHKSLVIQDLSTRAAALRTAKVDYLLGLTWETKDELVKSRSDLQAFTYIGGSPNVGWMRVDRKPFDDIRVRRALCMAIDYEAIKRDYYGGNAEIYCNWALPELTDYRVPLKDLPRETQELWEYHPDKAKQLLAEAGYPKGFSTSIVCQATSEQVDLLSAIKSYWAKIGVDLAIDAREYGVYASIYASKAHTQMLYRFNTAFQPWKFAPYRPGTGTNCAMVDDPRVNEAYTKASQADSRGDYAEQARLVKEIYPYIMAQAWCIQPPAPYVFNLWWPWVKRYYGEYSLGHYNYQLAAKYVWIDRELKENRAGR